MGPAFQPGRLCPIHSPPLSPQELPLWGFPWCDRKRHLGLSHLLCLPATPTLLSAIYSLDQHFPGPFSWWGGCQRVAVEPTACSGGATCYTWSLPYQYLELGDEVPVHRMCPGPLASQGLSSAPPGMRKDGLGQSSLKVPRSLGFPPAFLLSRHQGAQRRWEVFGT